MTTTTSHPPAPTALAALLPAALIGTERAPLPQPALPGPVGALLDAIRDASPDDAALVLLRSAGALAVCARAGAQGRIVAKGAAPLGLATAPAADETRPALADPIRLTTLERALRDGPQRLAVELMQITARQGWRLPPVLLPLALEQGRRATVLRPSLLTVIGERGRWLARHQSGWAFATGAAETADIETSWSEGSLDQRRVLLQAERQRDPAAARERLRAALPELPARERAELLGTLVTGLSDDDIELLDALQQQDRSREVRQVCAGLLQRLPGSAYSQRACARMAALLVEERSLLRKRWHLDAPAAADEAWKQDGIDPERPKGESLGERAWWLLQLVRQVPPVWWRERTGMDATALVAWAQSHDWGEALLRGWFDALLNVPDAELIDALLQAWPKPLQRHQPSQLMALLPRAARERLWLGQLRGSLGEVLLGKLGLSRSGPTRTALTELLPRLLEACEPGESLGAELSAELLKALPATLDALREQAYWDGHWRQQWAELAAVLHPDVLPQAAEACRTERHADALQAAATVIAARQGFLPLPAAA